MTVTDEKGDPILDVEGSSIDIPAEVQELSSPELREMTHLTGWLHRSFYENVALLRRARKDRIPILNAGEFSAVKFLQGLLRAKTSRTSHRHKTVSEGGAKGE